MLFVKLKCVRKHNYYIRNVTNQNLKNHLNELSLAKFEKISKLKIVLHVLAMFITILSYWKSSNRFFSIMGHWEIGLLLNIGTD